MPDEDAVLQERTRRTHRADETSSSVRASSGGRTQRTRMRLFEAAMVTMSEKGPTATTVDEVAEKAGVSKGTVYYNFGSKKSMVEGLLAYGVQLVTETIDEAGRGVADPKERLARGVVASLIFLEENPGFARLAVAEIWRPQGLLSEAMLEQRVGLVDHVTELVEGLKTHYRLAPAPDSRSVAVALFGSTFMLAMDSEMHLADRTVQDAARTVMTLIEGYVLGPRTDSGASVDEQV